MASYLDRSGVAANLGRGLLVVALLAGISAQAQEESKLKISGYAWSQYQEGMTQMHKGVTNYDFDPFFQFGGMAFLNKDASEHIALTASLGIGYGNSAIKRTLRDTGGEVLSKTNPNTIGLGMFPFLYEAALAWHSDSYRLKVGKFHYVYSDYNHNMGLYLLRGPVYPGFLYSGFNDIDGLSKVGALSSWSITDNLKWDVIASFETDFKPYMDLNLSSFLNFTAGPLEIGAGVEVQRLVEFNPCVTSPSGDDLDNCLGGDPNPVTVSDSANLYAAIFTIIDTVGGKADTTTYSLAGTKVMARAALDMKKIMAGYEGSAKDWVIYFEAALLGVQNYKHIYEKRGERIPVLVGLNLPTYGLLDLFSVEVEYYNAPYQNDDFKLTGAYDIFGFSDGNNVNYAMSPIPPSTKKGKANLINAQEDYDPKKDNLKWSILAKKQFPGNFTIKAQVASDHWRVPNNDLVHYEMAARPTQFYGSIRLEYGL